MSSNETLRLGMPLLQPAQAQKHVTVNEALMRLDGLVNLVLQGTNRQTPPIPVIDGACWAVPEGATGAWAGQAGQIAIGSNGGWVFAAPKPGMRGFIADQGVQAIFDGANWVAGALSLTGFGSALMSGCAAREVAVGTGAVVETGLVIPAGVMVIGAVARVTGAIGGTLASWRLGTPGAGDRFGSGLGTGTGSWARGMLGTPMTYYEDQPVQMTADGGAFAGGRVQVSVHWWELRLPAG